MATKSTNIIETLLGAFVIVVAGYFVYFAYSSGKEGRSFKGYTITAKFQKIDGLHVGSDVKVSGVKVGEVSALEIDPKSYRANATLYIDNAIKLPVDSSAAIVSEGLLGGKYISLDPGADSDLLTDKGEVTQTESSVNLETLLNKFLFSKSEDKHPTRKTAIHTSKEKESTHKDDDHSETKAEHHNENKTEEPADHTDGKEATHKDDDHSETKAEHHDENKTEEPTEHADEKESTHKDDDHSETKAEHHDENVTEKSAE